MKDSLPLEIAKVRKTKYPIHPLILSRWSPPSMIGEAIDEHELMTLLEAAHWATSSYNEQPWRFIYAKKNNIFKKNSDGCPLKSSKGVISMGISPVS